MVTTPCAGEKDSHSIPSRYFGTVSVSPSAEIHFPLGIPGFESENCLVALEIPEQRPLLYLQSKSNPDLCFLTLPVNAIREQAGVNLSDDEREALFLAGSERPADNQVLALAILFTVDGLMRVNLSAPLIVNLGKMIGLQRIPEAGTPFRYFELRESGDWVALC